MPGEVNEESVDEAIRLTLFVGAARAACTPEEAAALRAGLRGPLEDYRAGRYSESDIIDIVRQLMPDGWEPAPEWAEALGRAGFTRGETGK